MAAIAPQVDVYKQSLEELRNACKTDLFFLAKYILGYKEMNDKIHKPLCDIVQSVNPIIEALRDKKPLPHALKAKEAHRLGDWVTFEEKSKERLFNMFRGSFKTTIISISHTIQLMLLWPDIRILIASHKKEGGSGEILYAIKRHFISNECFRRLFPDYCPQPNTVGLIEWGTSERVTLVNRNPSCAWPEATIEIAGSTTDVTGRHYDYIKNDDLVTRDSVTNETMIAKTREFKALQKFLFNQPEWGITDVIGTPYHFNDLYSNLRKSKGITKVLIPALNMEGSPTFPERFTKEGLEAIRNDPSMGSYEFSCTPEGTPILMGDGSFKGVQNVRTGDEVVGFTKGIGEKRALVITKVLANGSRKATVYRYALSNGDQLYSTKDHKWFTGRTGRDHHLEYAPLDRGRRAIKVFNQINLHFSGPCDWASWTWLGGMIDGEGAVKHGSINITQSESKNPLVTKKIREVINKLGLSCKEYRKDSTIMFVLNGGKQLKMDLIYYAKPAKSPDIMDNILTHSKCFIQDEPKVIGVARNVEKEVYSLQTETGNYIANGYASSNCQYQMNPVPPEDQTFRPEWLEREGFFYDTPPSDLRVYIFVDPASKRRKTSDYTAIISIGIDHRGTIYLLDIIRDKLNPEGRTNLAIRTAKKHGLHKLHYETIGFQDTDKFIINRKSREAGYFISIVEMKAQGKSKEDRISGLQPLYERSDIRWPHQYFYTSEYDRKRYNMVEVLRDEMLMFPKCEHDDLLDAHSMLLQITAVKPTQKKPEINEDAFVWWQRQAKGIRSPNKKTRIGQFKSGVRRPIIHSQEAWR